MKYVIKKKYDGENTKNLIDAISKAYYSKEALKELINDCKNESALSLLTDKYTSISMEWNTKMSELENIIFGEFKGVVDYTYNISFSDYTVTISTDSEHLSSYFNN